MKKTLFTILAIFVTLFVCGNTAFSKNIYKETDFSYEVIVTYENEPVAGATVMCITESDEEILLKCNKRGFVKYETNEQIILMVGMALGLSEVVEIDDDGEINIQVQEVKQSEGVQIRSIGTFGVYSTDGNGDVSFKYQGAFQGYYCINYLPWIGFVSPDPNDWDGWDLTDWLPTWKGKKLLVPARYQTYHQTVYGYSISDALILMALI